jgi:hypothetical protein
VIRAEKATAAMSTYAVDVTCAAIDARARARASAAASRRARMRSRLLRGQNAALRAKFAARGLAQTKEAYTALLAELFVSSELMNDLWRSHAARCAHRRILERYAALGPSLPN